MILTYLLTYLLTPSRLSGRVVKRVLGTGSMPEPLAVFSRSYFYTAACSTIGYQSNSRASCFVSKTHSRTQNAWNSQLSEFACELFGEGVTGGWISPRAKILGTRVPRAPQNRSLCRYYLQNSEWGPEKHRRSMAGLSAPGADCNFSAPPLVRCLTSARSNRKRFLAECT